MSRLAIISVLAVGLCLPGCESLNPKNWHMPNFAPKKDKKDRDKDRDRADEPPPADPPALSGNQQPSVKGPYNGVLAGQVIDAFNAKRPMAIIQVAATDATPNEQPLEATANDQGYFTIQGLQPGRRYQLSCRAKRGDVVLAGMTIATPPNPVLLIRVTEDLANGGQPNATPAQTPPKNSMQSYNPNGPNGTPRYPNDPDRGIASLMPPKPIDESFIYSNTPPAPRVPNPAYESPADPKPPMYPQYQTREDSLARANDEALLNMPGAAPKRMTLGVPLGAAATARPRDAGLTGRTPLRTPACILTGNRLDDFALNDLDGRPFQFSDRRGKLTLIDFWGTWCGPCVKAIPHIVDLQKRYGADGLQVIGIAYEDGEPAEKAERVKFVRQRQGVNYQLLLGDDNCPLKSKLRIESFPTLILIDERGEIVFRCEGLSTEKKARLEQEIVRRLPNAQAHR